MLKCLIADDCWAWTDDPDWEEKVKQEVEEYALVKGEDEEWDT